ncbi:MAG TPA: hypothetical protein VNQ76_16395 [Planctomicrobium sp.]|nr:hypothetical protein [Planctomicrobium sp.]
MVVEGAVVLSVIVVVLLAGLDLSLAVLQYNTLSELSCKLSRQAIVHGEQAGKNNRSWGPQVYSSTADTNTEQAKLIRDLIVTFDPKDVHIRLEWMDGGNRLNHRVKVTVSADYVPIIRMPFSGSAYPLSASSVKRITY